MPNLSASISGNTMKLTELCGLILEATIHYIDPEEQHDLAGEGERAILNSGINPSRSKDISIVAEVDNRVVAQRHWQRRAEASRCSYRSI